MASGDPVSPIRESRVGTFRAAATSHRESTAAFADQVLSHPSDYSPKMVKKANFAHNAARWNRG